MIVAFFNWLHAGDQAIGWCNHYICLGWGFSPGIAKEKGHKSGQHPKHNTQGPETEDKKNNHQGARHQDVNYTLANYTHSLLSRPGIVYLELRLAIQERGRVTSPRPLQGKLLRRSSLLL